VAGYDFYQPVVANPNDGENITLCKILDALAAISPSVQNSDLPYTKVSTASTNATLIKASAGRMYNFIATNTVNPIRYVKFYDKATAPDPTNDTPDYIIPLNKDQSTSLALGVAPFYFHYGIGFAIVSSATGDGAVGAGDVVLSFTWS